MNPLISIILPTYNGASRITRAIQSVVAQSYQQWELLVISDGSTDNTTQIVESFSDTDKRVVFVQHEKNFGIQKSLNRGISLAKGNYIARIDDDDAWVDVNKLAIQIDFMEHNPEYVLVGTNAIIWEETGKEIGTYSMPTADESIRNRFLIKNCFLHPTVIARKETIEKVGRYDEDVSVRHIEDYDLWLRLGCVGKVANIAIPAVAITIGSHSVTFRNRITQARKVWVRIAEYKNKYPNFILGRIILSFRIIGFAALKVLPLPKSMLHAIQKLYKKL